VNWYDTPEFGDIFCKRNNTCEFCEHNQLFYGECHVCRETCLNSTIATGGECGACIEQTVEQYDDCQDGTYGVLNCLENCGQCENGLYEECLSRDGLDVVKLSIAEEHILLWEDAFRVNIEKYQAENPDAPVVLDFFLERSGDDLLKEAGEGDVVLIIMGYIGMMAFAIIALSRVDLLESRLSVGVLGVCMVILSVASSLGIIAMLIKFNPLHSQVLPFLALGLGVDDMFVLAMAFQFRKKLTVPEMTAEALQEAGASITLTSVVNAIAFAIGSAIPLPVVSDFSLAAMIVVIVNYFMILFAFSSLLTLNAYRVKEDLIDCFPIVCLPLGPGCIFPFSIWFCTRREDGTIGCRISGKKANKTHQEILEPEEVGDSGCNPTRCSKVSAAAILSKAGQAVTVVVTLTFIIIAATGASDAETGLPLADIVPGESYASPFLALRERDYGAFSSSVFVGMDKNGNTVPIDGYLQDPNFWVNMMRMEREISEVPGTSTRYPMFSTSFLDSFLQFNFNYTIDEWGKLGGSSLIKAAFVKQNIKQGGPYPELWQRNSTSSQVEQWTFSDGLCPTGWHDHLVDPRIRLYQGVNYTLDVRCTWPADEKFYQILKLFLQSSSGVSSVGNVRVIRKANEFNPGEFEITNVSAVALTFLQDGLYNIDDLLNYIRAIRKITDKYRDDYGYPIFPGGFVFDFYEQYLNVNEYLFTNLLYVLIGVFFASFFFLFHGITTFLMMLCIMCTIFQIYGFLAFSGLKINGVCVVNLVMGVGVSVEFTAHIARVFMIVAGTRMERAIKALETMFFPIVLGAISTFIGNFPMYFANFPYFRLYFFNMYVLIIFFGTFNGLCLLPMLLGYVGPDSLRVDSPKEDVELAQDPKETNTGAVPDLAADTEN
jgi:patched 1 protein